MIKEEIKSLIERAIKDLQKEKKIPEFKIPEISIEAQKEKRHGDYSSNIVWQLTKKFGLRPIKSLDLSKEISVKIFDYKNAEKIFKHIDGNSPGFLNFFIADKVFIDNLKNINNNYGKGKELKNKKVIIDYTDPNILKEFHIGHLLNNAVGESLSRIFEFQGAKVKRICYQSDVGISVAKAMWGILQNKNNFPKDTAPLSERIKFLGSAYVQGSEKYESDEKAKKEIIELNKKIFEKSDKKINKLYEKGKKWSLEHFDELYKKLGTKFDYLIFESQVSDLGKKIVEKGLKSGVFEKGQNGAIIFKGEKYGLHTRVFINSEGLPTYEAKDLGLAQIKYKKYPYNLSFVVTGNEINEYFKVMKRALQEVLPDLAEKTKYIGHGMLRLPEGKMSSRIGNIVTAESLIEKVQDLVKNKIKDRELSDAEKQEITEKVAIGALKYSILKQSIGSDIIYDFDKSISFEGDSGPYLQYSYTRAMSVLRKAENEKIKPSFKKIPGEVSLVEKMIYYFPEVAEKASKEHQPHYITLYLTELSGAFNNYYANNKIVDKNDVFSPYKIALTAAFSIIMKNGMWMLGIDALEKM